LLLYEGNCGGGWELGTGGVVGTGWNAFSWVLAPGDFAGDGCADVLARRADNNTLRLYEGNCAGGWKAGTGGVVGTGWGIFDWILGPGDFSGDGCADVLARKASNADVLLYAGNCAGGWQPGAPVVATGWGIYDWLLGPGDFNGDGCADVLVRKASNGDLLMYRGNCAGGWKSSQALLVGTGWAVFDSSVGPGDFDGDGCLDVLSRRADNGTLRLYAGNCAGGWKAGTGGVVGTGWGIFNWIL
jgi:hypothetical protein